jgi:hypothetical protein
MMKHAWIVVCSFIACERGNALVDGQCLAGFMPQGNQCVPITDALNDVGVDGDASNSDVIMQDGTNPDGTSDADVITDAFMCDDGLTLCNGVCVDTTSDPFNCGACNIVCASLLCSNSLCQGAVPGSLIVIGHDYEVTYSAAQQRVLANALLVSSASPLRVRLYEQYASAAAITNVKSILTAAATGAGRVINYTAASTPSDVTPGMNAANTDVLVIFDQVNAPASTLAAIGTGWATTITSFSHVGGVVIALDGLGGTSPQMPALIKSAKILDVSSDTTVAQGSALDVVAPSDSVGIGVVSPYGAGKHSVFFACNEPNTPPVTYIVEDPANDAGPTQPVVIHKVAP